MIDWTLPVETTEDPPRPVRVLFDKDGVATHVEIKEYVYTLSPGKTVLMQQPGVRLRNVPPPKPEPVLREAWVTLEKSGHVLQYSTEESARECADDATAEVRRITWMSDGSPVPSEASGEGHTNCWANYNSMTADRDHWKAKAEALQAEVDRQKPVVDAAVDRFSGVKHRPEGLKSAALWEAVRAYQSKSLF